jgi:hypothetical protein
MSKKVSSSQQCLEPDSAILGMSAMDLHYKNITDLSCTLRRKASVFLQASLFVTNDRKDTSLLQNLSILRKL